MPHAEAVSKVILIGLDAAVASLVEELLDAGVMPNLAALIKRGAYTRVRSVFPGVTPINWATVSTGAYPGTHGIPDFAVLLPGDPLDGGRDAFEAGTYQAETLWQAACRAGLKAATINFPGATPPDHPNHVWIAGRGSPAAFSPYALRGTSCFATQPHAASLRDAQQVYLDGSAITIRLKPDADPEGDGPTLRLVIGESDAGQPGASVHNDGDARQLAFLTIGQPGPWLWGEFIEHGTSKRGSYRLELTRLEPEFPSLAVYVSQVTCPRDIARPPELGEALVEAFGPFIDYCGARGYDRGWIPASRMIEEGRYKGLWFTRAARKLLTEHDCHVVVLKWHLLDHIQHAIWGGFDPISPWFEPENATHYEKLIRDSYAAADAMIGELLPLLDEGVTLAVVSDHGHLPHLKSVSINNLLGQHGLIATLSDDSDPPPVDWSRTQAFGGPALGHIWVNLAGRQPEGIVPEGEYDSVRQQIIDLLLGLRDPDTGAQPVARAMRKEEAEGLGLWGERVGDVIYLMTPGYSGDFNWSPLSHDGQIIVPLGPKSEPKEEAEYGEGKFIAHKFQSVHGCGDPAASLGKGTEEAILAIAGPAIHSGATLDTVPDLTAVAPTIATACGLTTPSDSQGEVLETLLFREADRG